MVDRQTNFILKARDAASGPIGRVGKAMHDLERQAKNLGGKTLGGVSAGIGKLARVAATVGAASLAVLAGGFVAAVSKAAAFEKAMLNVNSIAKVAPAEFEKMKASVLALTRELPQSAETLAQGLYDIESSGFAGAEGIKVLEAAAKAASAGLSTTSDAAKAITAVLNAYGYGADKAGYVSDVLFKTVDKGVITFTELASQIGDVTSIAPLLGVSLEEVGAGFSVLTKHGINAAESATALGSLLRSILSPSKEAAALAKDLGLQWNVGALKAKGLVGVLADLEKKAGGDDEVLATLTGNARAIKAMFVLAANGGREFNEALGFMQGAAGATETALSYQRQGLSYQLDILKNNLGNVAIAIGTKLLPVITPLVVKISDFIVALMGTDEPMRRLGMGAGDAEEQIRPLTDKLSEWGPLGDILQTVIGHVQDSFADLRGIWEKIGPTVAKVVAAIFGPGGLYDKFKEIIGQVGDYLIPKFEAFINTLVGPGGVVDSVSKVVGPIIQRLLPAFGDIVTSIFGGGKKKGLLPALGDLIGELWGNGKGPLALALMATADLVYILLAAVNFLIGAITTLIDKARELGKVLPKGITFGPPTLEGLKDWGGKPRAAGGPVRRGEPYLVGERGMELFVPNEPGNVVRNGGFGVASGRSQVTVHVNHPTFLTGSPSEIRKFVYVLIPELKRELSRFNISLG